MKRSRRTNRIVFLLVIVLVTAARGAMDIGELRGRRTATHFRAVDFVPGTRTAFAAGFEGRIMRSDDGGVDWKRLETGVITRFYDIQALDARHIFACGSGGMVLITSDGGAHWSPRALPVQTRMVGVFFLNPLTGWVVGDDGAIFHTRDGGRNWKRQLSGVTSGLRRVWFADCSTGYALGYQGVVLKTTNGGANWIRLKAPAGFSGYGADFVNNGDEIFIAGSFGSVIHSTDGGQSWRFMPSETRNFLRDVCMLGPRKGFAVGYGWILRYDAKEQRWKRACNTHRFHLQSVDFGIGGCGVAVGRWGIIYHTSDGGAHWSYSPEMFSPDLKDVAISPGGECIAVGVEGYYLCSVDAGKTWRLGWLPNKSMLTAVAIIEPGRYVAAGKHGAAFITENSGKTWHEIPLPDTSNFNDVFFLNSQRGFIAGDNGVIFTTADGGRTWKDVSLDRGNDIAGIFFTDAAHGWLWGSEGMVMETRNGGSSWIQQYTGISEDMTCACFRSDGTSIIGIRDGTLLLSASTGYNSSWERRYPMHHILAISPDCAIAAASDGVFIGADFHRIPGVGEMSRDGIVRGFSRWIPGVSAPVCFAAGDFGSIVRITRTP